MNIGKLIEVGVAVADLAAASGSFSTLLDAPLTDTIQAPMFAMDFRMCRLGDVDFELMTAYGADSVISRFIARRGEGLHHIAFQVADIAETIAQCHQRGLPILSDEPVLLGGLRAAFLHPACLSGLLVEFVENLHGWPLAHAHGRPERDIGRISGFGVAVKDVDAAALQYAAVLGAEISERRWNEQIRAHVRHAWLNGIRFEIFPVEASRPASLGGDGQGLHHVCLDVRQPNALASIRLPTPARGAAEAEVFHTDPRACHGVMFEIHADAAVPLAALGE